MINCLRANATTSKGYSGQISTDKRSTPSSAIGSSKIFSAARRRWNMIRLTSSLVLTAAFLLSATSFADDTAKPDDQIAADYLAQYVYELTTPMYVFHWFSAEGRNSIWKSAQSYRS